MYKILVLALREFRTSVRTKSFIIGLIVTPVFMFGSLLAMQLFKDKVDISEKTIYVIDQTNKISDAIVDAAKAHNERDVYD